MRRIRYMRNLTTSKRCGGSARSSVLAVMVCGALLSACAGPSNEQIAALANTGIAFSKQVPEVYDYAFQHAALRESADLLKQRADMRKLGATDGSRLETSYRNRKAALAERQDAFGKMIEHAAKLEAYFSALQALSSGKAAEDAAGTADGIASQLGALSLDFKAIKVGSTALSSLFKPVTALAVSSFANEKLQTHLKQHAKSVHEAIALQRSMFKLLLEQERTRRKAPHDVALQQSLKNLTSELPADWTQRWVQSFDFRLQSTPVSVAEKATGELETAFKQLVETGTGTLAQVERSIVLIDAIVSIFKGNPTGADQ